MKESFLVVVLDEMTPDLILVPENREQIVRGSQELRDTGIRTLVGYFDWLRMDEGTVIGVRLTLFDDELKYLIPALARPSYVEEILSGNGIEIFFSESRAYDAANSDDQDFMDNWIYESTDGIYAISFNAQYAIDSLSTNKDVVVIR